MSTQYAYAPYGYHRLAQVSLGFTGELVERATGHYLLGNGYRAYNPVLMNFNSPDSMSPFAKGGLNGYGYCQRDPVNNKDPSGHVKVSVSQMPRLVLLGCHATDAFNVKGLLQGVSRGHSRPGRQAQGEAFYLGPDSEYVEPYRKAAIEGVTLVVLLKAGVSLVPGIGYKKDAFDVTAILPAAYDAIEVVKEAPPDARPANLPRTGIFARKKTVLPGSTSKGAEAPFVEAVKIRETQT
ncbi:RHS repeat-associated core domain-containing protein [Pseudomonas soli]|jgi:RHS repeat-associated protein|nr:RHS repeat-associated core domain-containing protein [Pseudomonas soli]